MCRRWIGVFFFVLIAAGVASAQDAPPVPTPNDDLTIAPIAFDQIVADTITEMAIYDWWQISLQADDVIVVDMQAFEGLSPLIGILAPDNELVARSDADHLVSGAASGPGHDDVDRLVRFPLRHGAQAQAHAADADEGGSHCQRTK